MPCQIAKSLEEVHRSLEAARTSTEQLNSVEPWVMGLAAPTAAIEPNAREPNVRGALSVPFALCYCTNMKERGNILILVLFIYLLVN